MARESRYPTARQTPHTTHAPRHAATRTPQNPASPDKTSTQTHYHSVPSREVGIAHLWELISHCYQLPSLDATPPEVADALVNHCKRPLRSPLRASPAEDPMRRTKRPLPLQTTSVFAWAVSSLAGGSLPAPSPSPAIPPWPVGTPSRHPPEPNSFIQLDRRDGWAERPGTKQSKVNPQNQYHTHFHDATPRLNMDTTDNNNKHTHTTGQASGTTRTSVLDGRRQRLPGRGGG